LSKNTVGEYYGTEHREETTLSLENNLFLLSGKEKESGQYLEWRREEKQHCKLEF
jgi:hypothetical protein